MPSGAITAAIAIEDFLVTAQAPKAMDEFYNVTKANYGIKRLGRPSRYLGWHCHYHDDVSMALNQRLEVDKTLDHSNMIGCNGKHTPFRSNKDYHEPTSEATALPDTIPLDRKLVGDLRCIADSTRPDITFVLGWLGAAMAQPTARQWNI